jgi:hypothetical protein
MSGKPDHLKARSGKPGRQELDDDERIKRAYGYATNTTRKTFHSSRNA